ncbi:MAG: hypothetical protein AABZ31_12355 [Bdellovibrionota bacterium]
MVTRNVTFKAFAMLIFLGCALSLASAQAAQKTTKKSSKRGQVVMKPGVIKQNLSTDMRFDDLSVKGKRQTPLGLQVVVEAEKDVPSLVDFRKNYKDRAQNSLSGR